jgi:hypothetical protein
MNRCLMVYFIASRVLIYVTIRAQHVLNSVFALLVKMVL